MSKLSILEKLKNEIYLIAGDASPRKFFRFKSKKGQVLVHCHKDKKTNLKNYIKVNNLLIQNNFKAPKTLVSNFKKDYIIIEDFGDNLIKKTIKNKKNVTYIFKKIIDELVKLQKIKIRNRLPNYSYKLLSNELKLFYDWYLPEFFNKKKANEIKNKINLSLKKLIKDTVEFNNVFVHRDFHVENLVIYKKKIAFLDTQDAVIGHPAYDLMSLIDDVRINLKKEDQLKLLNYYIKISNKVNRDFIYHFHILSIQRQLKILGIFIRLYRRDQKKKYLKYLLRTWKLIDLRLKYSKLSGIKFIFDKYFPNKIKRKKWK